MAETVLDPEVVAQRKLWGPAFTRLELPAHPTTHPPGTVIVISGALTRYAACIQSLITMNSPAGSVVSWSAGVSIAQNLNHALAQRRGEWVWLMGDDHVFAPDTLLRLLDHEVDVVAPVCLLRQPPYTPLVFRSESPPGIFEIWPQAELPTHGLHPIVGASGAGLLLRDRVLHALEPPYVEVGKIRPDELGEDLYLYYKIRRAGFQPYIDCDTVIGHITPTVLWPSRGANGWDITLDPACTIPISGCEGPA